MGRDGRKPLEHVEHGQCTPSEFVHKQLLQTDRSEPAGRLTFFERRESVAFRLERGAQTIEGYLLDLTHDSLALRLDSLALKLSWQTPTGCIRRTIWAPYENGYLIDTEGRLNEFGLQIAVELIDDIYEAAVAMKSRIKDIKRALGQRRGEVLRDEWSFGPGPEEWRRAVWDALPRPALDIDCVLFDSILEEWLCSEVYGLGDADTWDADAQSTEGSAATLLGEVSPMVCEGSVDQSEMHILVVNGGCLDEEPEAVDVALLGRDPDDGVIVEFLRMDGVDPEAAARHRGYTRRLVASLAQRSEPHPWRSVAWRCDNPANADGPLRFNLQLGKRPLVHLPHPERRAAGLVSKQPSCVKGIGPLGRFKVYDQREYVGIHLMRDEKLIKGWIAWLTKDSVAVVLTRPLRGGCVLRTISTPCENGQLVDDEGHLNGYGLQVAVELLNDMYEAAMAMEHRLPDVMQALRTAYESVSTEEARIRPTVDARLRAIWKAVSEPAFDFDIAFFKSAIHAWGKKNPEYFDDDVWWVHR
jgi:hypothetical protein